MNTKLLRDVVEECRNEKEADLLPFPEQFAQCVAEMENCPNSCEETGGRRPAAFVTSSGLRFVFANDQ